MWLDLLFTLLLVLLNGFFVAAEFAIVKVRVSQIEILAREGNTMAKLTSAILHKLDAYLSATQLGITLASLGLGWVGESVVAKVVIAAMAGLGYTPSIETAHTIAVPIAFAIITVLHIVLGELAPKSMAIGRPEQTALAVSLPLRVFYVIFRPAIWALNRLAIFVLKLLRLEPAKGHEVHSPEELLYILEQTGNSGGLHATQQDILENAFEFPDLSVRQIMVPRTSVISVSLNEGSAIAIDKCLKSGYSRMPVYGETIDDIKGIVHIKDLLSKRYKGEDDSLQTLLKAPFYVPESKKVGSLLRDLQSQRKHMAVVIDEFGGTAGLVTLEDVLEELVGEIQDEYDNESPIVSKSVDGSYLVSAMAKVPDANEFLPRELPEGETYDTVAGYINALFGYIPAPEESVNTDDYLIIVTKSSGSRVEEVAFHPKVKESKED